MLEKKILQLQHESDSWKRELKFILKENSFLVHRLSEVLKNETNLYSLEEMEVFLDKFILENNIIKRLQSRIMEFDKLLAEESNLDGKIVNLQKLNYTDLKRKITITEKDFNKLKKNFNSYLSKANTSEEKANK